MGNKTFNDYMEVRVGDLITATVTDIKEAIVNAVLLHVYKAMIYMRAMFAETVREPRPMDATQLSSEMTALFH